MKDILMDYLQTGYEGQYRPRDVVAAIENGELYPVFSGTDACTTTERGLEIRRQMFVEGRRFIISSVLSPTGGDTPTKRRARKSVPVTTSARWNWRRSCWTISGASHTLPVRMRCGLHSTSV